MGVPANSTILADLLHSGTEQGPRDRCSNHNESGLGSPVGTIKASGAAGTLPWEELMKEEFEGKIVKYEVLGNECQNRGWRTRCDPIELRLGGYVGKLLFRALKLLRIGGMLSMRGIKKHQEHHCCRNEGITRAVDQTTKTQTRAKPSTPT